ncbi:MAG: acetate--CoA ligase [Acidobacteriota bacterium]
MSQDIKSVLNEERSFPPDPGFQAKANVTPEDLARMREQASRDPEGFWASLAGELTWRKPWTKVLSWDPPFARWFEGGELNLTESCLDRHVATWRKNKAAIVWEGEPGDTRVLTYHDLHREVTTLAAALRARGLGKGDRVAIYMPLVPEAAVAMLACARLGAPHTVIFGGFSAEALKDRINDAEAALVITADGGYRRGQIVPLKKNVDDALVACPSVKTVVVLRRTGQDVPMAPGRDVAWHDLVAGHEAGLPAEPVDAEHPLFILYTSGTTGKPKGVVHTTGGYLTQAAATTRWVFDLKDEDTFWCTADIGWVTGHSYVVFGPLCNGATTVLYEGAPNWPDPGRFWSIIEKHGVSILYTAPTAIRAFMRWGDQWPGRHDLSSLRLLGTVGEPINPEAWMWYRKVIGGERCPIVDTWWQTETGAILITPLPGCVATKPGSATLPLPGIDAAVVNKEGQEVGPNVGGLLVIRKPWPSMLRTIYKDPERFRRSYFAEIPGNVYFTGDGARRDQDGYFWIMGRVDDVINVAGHRLGTMEIESALVSHPLVAEAAVVGRPDDLKGTAIAAFVTLGMGHEKSDTLKDELKKHVVKEIGALARPDDIRFSDALPKTRSGKIMRRLLRKIASGDETLGDTSTLEDLSVLSKLQQEDE